MIRSVTVVNQLGEMLTMELSNPWRSGFNITNITGLGAPKGVINSTAITTGDGDRFNSARTDKRNIVLSIDFVEIPDIESARHLSYQMFPVKQMVTLIFETDSRMSVISGYVESNEPNIFSRKEGTQISILCMDPYFQGIGEDIPQITPMWSIENTFEFPFWNDSITYPLLTMGNVEIRQEAVVYYPGEVPTGAIFTLTATDNVTNVKLYNTRTGESMYINTTKLANLTGSSIIAGDEITIDTNRGSKSITLLRDGVRTSILSCIDYDSDWFVIRPGDNLFAYTATIGALYLQVQITNQVLYEGV